MTFPIGLPLLPMKNCWVIEMCDTYFEYLGIRYRCNADASLVERYDGPKLGWNRTASIRIYNIARATLELS